MRAVATTPLNPSCHSVKSRNVYPVMLRVMLPGTRLQNLPARQTRWAHWGTSPNLS